MRQTDMNREILDRKLEAWTRNATGNLENFKSIGKDIGAIEGVARGKPVLILGPGPSLDLIAPYLGHCTKGDVVCFACNTALNPLAARGFIPDLLACYDADEAVANQVDEYVRFCPKDMLQQVTMVCPVTIHPRVPRLWPGPVVWFRPEDPSEPCNATFHRVLRVQFPELGAIGNCSCVFLLLIRLAIWAKAEVVLSCGFDLPVNPADSYSAVRYDLSGVAPVPLLAQPRVIDETIQRLHQRYTGSLLGLIAAEGVPFVNLSPLASFKHLVRTLPPRPPALGAKGE